MLGARPDGNRSGRVPRRGSTRMSESQSQSPQSPQSQPQPQPQPAEPGPESIDLTKLPAPEPSSAAAGPAPAPVASRRSLRLPGRRGVRWVLGAAVVVVLGVAAVGTGVALERHHERGVPVFDRAYVGRGPLAAPGVPKAPGVPGKVVVRGADGSVQVFPGAGAEQLPEGVAGARASRASGVSRASRVATARPRASPRPRCPPSPPTRPWPRPRRPSRTARSTPSRWSAGRAAAAPGRWRCSARTASATW